MTLRIRIVDTRTQAIREEVSRSVLLVPESPAVKARLPATMGAFSFFTLVGRPIFPLIVAADDPRRPSRFLDPATYPAGQVADQLSRWHQMGINTVGVTLDRREQMPQLRHLLARAADPRMYVMIHLPIFPKTAIDWRAAGEFIDQLAQSSTPSLLAIDVASPEGAPGFSPDAIRAWIAEANGLAPSATVTSIDEPAVAARCNADLAARHLTAIRQRLRLAGLDQMVFDSGLFGEAALGPQSVATVADFATARIGSTPARESLERAAFQIAWTRGFSAGRPVLLMGDQRAPPAFAPESAFARQADDGARLITLALTAQVAGVYFPVAEDGSDPLMQPDGKWRPAAIRLRNFQSELRAWPRLGSPPARSVPCEPGENPYAVTGRALEDFSAAFRGGEWREIRPPQRDLDTRDLTPTPISAHPLRVWKELGAIWTDLEVNGDRVWRAPGEPLRVARRDRVRLTICNAGLARWIPRQDARVEDGMVRVQVTAAGGATTFLLVPKMAMGESAPIDWIPADAGNYTLRIAAPPIGSWGEALHVVVDERRASPLEVRP